MTIQPILNNKIMMSLLFAATHSVPCGAILTQPSPVRTNIFEMIKTRCTPFQVHELAALNGRELGILMHYEQMIFNTRERHLMPILNQEVLPTHTINDVWKFFEYIIYGPRHLQIEWTKPVSAFFIDTLTRTLAEFTKNDDTPRIRARLHLCITQEMLSHPLFNSLLQFLNPVHLRVSLSPDITDFGRMPDLLKTLSGMRLETLHIFNHATFLPLNFLLALEKPLSLTGLHIHYWNDRGLPCIVPSLARFNNLNALSLHGLFDKAITAQLCTNLAQLPALEDLDLAGNFDDAVTESLADMLRKTSNLKRFNFSGDFGYDSAYRLAMAICHSNRREGFFIKSLRLTEDMVMLLTAQFREQIVFMSDSALHPDLLRMIARV